MWRKTTEAMGVGGGSEGQLRGLLLDQSSLTNSAPAPNLIPTCLTIEVEALWGAWGTEPGVYVEEYGSAAPAACWLAQASCQLACC